MEKVRGSQTVVAIGVVVVGCAFLAGCNGSAGPAGPQGPAGAAGTMGATGPQGPRGEQGPAGAQGAMGMTGAMGSAGERGATGPAGPSGMYGAYVLMSAGNYSPTEQSGESRWIENVTKTGVGEVTLNWTSALRAAVRGQPRCSATITSGGCAIAMNSSTSASGLTWSLRTCAGAPVDVSFSVFCFFPPTL